MVFRSLSLFVISIILVGWPIYALAQNQPSVREEVWQQVQLLVHGLKCSSCIPDVEKAFRGFKNVKKVEVTRFGKEGSKTVIEVIPETITDEELIKALAASGFQTKVTARLQPRTVAIEQNFGKRWFGLFD